MEIIQCSNTSLYYKYMHIPTKVWEQNYGQQVFFVGFALARFSTKNCATLGLTQSMTCSGAQQ